MIEVRIAGRGSVRNGVEQRDPQAKSVCDFCSASVDAVASCGLDGSGPFACKACLRTRLEAMTLGAWMLRDAETPLPWGKVSG